MPTFVVVETEAYYDYCDYLASSEFDYYYEGLTFLATAFELIFHMGLRGARLLVYYVSLLEDLGLSVEAGNIKLVLLSFSLYSSFTGTIADYY